MKALVEDYDIVVVGAGHAGCEAALAGSKTWPEHHYVYGKCRKHCAYAL